MTPAEIIRRKRDALTLSAEEIDAFVRGLTADGDAAWSEGQVAALAMAICLRGMDADETVALTRAMTDSGERLHWRDAGFDGPILDKHSTGGVGDKVSLMLAPIVAACGGVVPMISGRGLGHTGGTLDKLEALPGYRVDPSPEVLRQTLRDAGCAIVGASARLAPADRRLYAIRDVTATVESVPLITASILSKKLAAGLDALVLDVKVGNGAFCRDKVAADLLAQSLVTVARGLGLPATALITDMNEVLGTTAGNALELWEAVDFLTGAAREPRLEAVTLSLAAELLRIGGLATSDDAALARATEALTSGAAAERFARMVRTLGGPADVLTLDRSAWAAPATSAALAPQPGRIVGVDTRACGLIVAGLGGGRSHAGDAVDHRVGLSHVLPVGRKVEAGEPLALVHASTEAAAIDAARQVVAAYAIERAGEKVANSQPVYRRVG